MKEVHTVGIFSLSVCHGRLKASAERLAGHPEHASLPNAGVNSAGFTSFCRMGLCNSHIQYSDANYINFVDYRSSVGPSVV